jgi:DNA polymerase elongation subunit (family B)
MTTTQSTQAPQFIPFEKVKEYVDANIPIVPLKANGDPHTYYLYESDAEKNTLANDLPENIKKYVCSGDYIQVLKLLNQQIPTTFWTDKRIKDQQWYGIGCKTGLTAIRAKSDPNKVLLVIAIDADNEKPRSVLEKLVNQYGLLEKTLVQKTPHGGLHVVFAVAVDANNFEEIKSWENKSKLQAICKEDCKIELKSQNMQITLDPTKHRVDRHLTYTRISKVIAISEEPTFCDELFKSLKENDCLSQTLEEYYAGKVKQAQFDSSRQFNKDAQRSDLKENEINKAIDIILGRDEANKNENYPFGSIYIEGQRNDVCLCLSGFFYWSHITQLSAEVFIRKLAQDTNDGSADVNKAVSNVAAAYKRGDSGLTVIGISGVIEQFLKCIKDSTKPIEERQRLAEDRLYQFSQALNVVSKRPTREAQEESEDIRLASEKVTSKDIDFVIESVTKEAPDDKEPAKQVFYGMFTGFTKTPMSHNVNSRDSGSGKSYIVVHVSDYFPDKYVLPKNAVSNKAIFHRRGKLVQRRIDDKTGKEYFEPIAPQLNKLISESEDIENKLSEEKAKKKAKDEKLLIKLQTEISATNIKIEELKDNAFKLIDLENQIILALDTPQDEFLEALMSIISQDTTRDQEYEFVERNSTGKLINRINILHGTPCIFTTRTIDDTRTLRHEEKTRRLINVAPNTSKEKINHASNAIISRNCLLPIEYENLIGLSQQDKEKCKHIAAVLIAKLKRHSRFLEAGQPGIKVAFLHSINAAMPTAKDHEVWLMTVSDRLSKYLAIITKLNMDSRWKIVDTDTGQFWPISNYQDLKETLLLMKNGASSVRVYQAQFYNNRFLPLFKKLGDSKDTFQKSGNIIITEAVTGFTARKLEEEIKKEFGETVGRKTLEDKLLYPLVNLGILNTVRSQIDGRMNLFFPVAEGKIFSLFDDPDDPRFKITDPTLYPNLNLIEESYRFIINYSHKQGASVKKKFKLVDTEGKERTVKDLVNFGLGSAEISFVKGWDDRLIADLDKRKQINIEKEEEITKNQTHSCENNLTDVYNNVSEKSEEPTKIEIQPISTLILNAERLKFKELSEKGNSIRQISEILGISKGACQRHSDYIKQHPEEFGTIGTASVQSGTDLIEQSSEVYQKNVPNCTKPNPGTLFDTDLVQSGTPFGTTKESAFTIKNEPFKPIPPPSSLIEQVPKLAKFATFDTEWYRDDLKQNRDKGISGNIYCFCLSDSEGKDVKLHLDEFDGDRYKLMSAILDVMASYESLAGFAIFSDRDFISDVDRIKINCTNVGLSERYEDLKSKIEFIDIHKMFSNNTVKGFLKLGEKVVYREDSLEPVAQAYIGEGKTQGVSGVNVEFLPHEDQLEYCLRDAQLCYKILQKNNFELSQIFYEIGVEINMTFFQTCNAGYPTGWWASKLKSIDYQKVPSNVQQWIEQNMTYNNKMNPKKRTGVKYLGGHVIDPRMGRHLNAVSYDVSSMYPTMANVHNISTETVCCECCKDDPTAKVPDSVMKDINDYVLDPENKAKKKEARPWHYWICQKQRGKFADIMKDLIQRKIQYKESGVKLKEKAMKILMNSGYGGFGNAYFEYIDPRVAELIPHMVSTLLSHWKNSLAKRTCCTVIPIRSI